MGATFSVAGRRNSKLLINGLDASGKTTILYQWKSGEVVTTIPTVGFNVEEVQVSKSHLVVSWDAGGGDKLRPLFRHYYKGLDCFVWVMDSNDRDRMDQAYDEFHRMCADDVLVGKPVLVLCNKQDILGAQSPHDVAKRLELTKIKDRRVIVIGVSATSGEGLKEALNCLDDLISNPTPIGDEGRVSVLAGKNPYVLPDLPDYGLTEMEGNVTLKRFAPIKMNTECPFAKSAKLWGGKPMEPGSTIEEQAKANYAGLCHFVRQCQQGMPLDGFCIEIDHHLAQAAKTTAEFEQCVRLMLTSLSDLDPRKEFVMRVKYKGARGWRFRFAGVDFFVTTFSPCYPVTSSRYTLGAEHAFVLLQPEISFLSRNLPQNTPRTNRDHPITVRDRSRLAYESAGRSYYIPDSAQYPPAEHIVKPIKDDGQSVVRWWEASLSLH
ncbi:hypothetical protein ACA910_010855 [Epithemia clementina (nom. ined.)]